LSSRTYIHTCTHTHTHVQTGSIHTYLHTNTHIHTYRLEAKRQQVTAALEKIQEEKRKIENEDDIEAMEDMDERRELSLSRFRNVSLNRWRKRWLRSR
jgi:hypothetical protein